MRKRKIALIISASFAAILLLTAAVSASIENIAENWLINKVVEQNKGGISIEKNKNEADPEKKAYQALPPKYKKALESNYIYLYEMYADENNNHAYRYVRAFSEEELKDATFSDDYSRIIIQNKPYIIKWGYPGQLREEDDRLPEMDEWTVILRVFTEENWEKGNEIFAKEIFEGIKREVIIPISEGRAAIYSNEDESLIRTITDEEISIAKVSENGVFVIIDEATYIVNYSFNEDFTIVEEIRLRPRDGYKGDAGFQNPDDYKFFTISEWLEG